MEKSKPESRLTKVDLDAVLKLQMDYTQLQCEVVKTLWLVKACNEGNCIAADYVVRSKNDDLHLISRMVYNMAKRIQELESKVCEAKCEERIPE